MTQTLRASALLAALLALATIALAGCHRRARTDQVVVTQTAGGGQPISISHRHYRNLLNIAARDMRCDHRQLAPQEVSPGIFAIQGCGQLRDYVMVCRGRHHCRWMGVTPVEQVALAETQCQTGTVQLAITGPLSRQVVACGQTLDYGLACGPQGCMWARGAAPSAMVMQTEPGTSVVIVAEDPGTAAVPPPPAGSTAPADASDDVVQVGVAGTLQSLFATQIAAVQQCTGGQRVTVRVLWDAAGTVSIALAAPHAGTPMEQCVQQAIGPVVLQGITGPGEVDAQM